MSPAEIELDLFVADVGDAVLRAVPVLVDEPVVLGESRDVVELGCVLLDLVAFVGEAQLRERLGDLDLQRLVPGEVAAPEGAVGIGPTHGPVRHGGEPGARVASGGHRLPCRCLECRRRERARRDSRRGSAPGDDQPRKSGDESRRSEREDERSGRAAISRHHGRATISERSGRRALRPAAGRVDRLGTTGAAHGIRHGADACRD